MSSRPISLSPGDRLGRYEIVSLLGTGGMGEVYRARDPELHRDVALKVLRRPSATPDDLARFTREARTAGGLNHPNIVAVYDVGVEAGVPFVVTELLEGETLRARLDRGALPFLKAVDYGTQIAAALGAAHARSIWHRDVKPANAFITSDGRVKLLDFGIAKLGERHLASSPNDPTNEISEPHHVFGTAGYMAPEQVLGQPADHRADLFALGAVLYEMFTRERAFKRGSTVETMTAVLQDDPVDPLALNPNLPPLAVAIVRRCLEKNKEERFQSARDLAFDLQQLRDLSTSTKPLPAPPIRRRRAVRVAAAVAIVAAAVAAGWLLAPPPAPPAFEQLTFRRARISAARFVSDDRSVVYSESRQGGALELSRLNLGENPPARLDYPPDTDILAARSGELTLSIGRRFLIGERVVGTLASAPLGGGAPRPLEENVEDADWDATGTRMVIVRSSGVGRGTWLEYPADTKIYETTGSIRFPRVSRDGARIVFVEDPVASGEGGHVSIVDAAGGRGVTVLAGPFKSIRGLAWSPDGREIWFAAGSSRTTRQLLGVTPAGHSRVVMAAPGSLALWDIAADGRVLLSRDDERRELVGLAPGDTAERELSQFDDSGLADISADGGQLLFSDRFGVYLRDIRGGLVTQLGSTDAYADDLSADARKVLATSRDGSSLLILSTGAVDNQTVTPHGIIQYRGARWFPDGRRVLFTGQTAQGSLRSYIQAVPDGKPEPLTPDLTWAVAISADGRLAAAVSDVRPGITLWSVDGSAEPRPVAGSQDGDRPVCFSNDGRTLWAFRRDEVPMPVIRFDLANGRREIAKTLAPPDAAGVYSITEFAITPDGRSYYYSYKRLLSQLYLVTGLR